MDGVEGHIDDRKPVGKVTGVHLGNGNDMNVTPAEIRCWAVNGYLRTAPQQYQLSEGQPFVTWRKDYSADPTRIGRNGRLNRRKQPGFQGQCAGFFVTGWRHIEQALEPPL